MQKKFTAFLAFLFFFITAHAALPFEQLLYKGRAVPFYNDSSNSEQQRYINMARESRLAERMANMVSSSIMMKTDIGIGFESCGQINAFFNPQRSAIVICSEFIDLMAKTAFNDKEFMMKLQRDEFGKAFDGLIWGIFLHELAHAIIHINMVPVTGREEDVADQFTVWYAVNFVGPNQIPIVMPTIWFWSRLALERDIPSMSEQERKSFMSDEHSLDEQRIFNMACWVLGTGSEGGANTAQYAELPPERAQRCQGEYTLMDRGMRSHFKKYLKLSPLHRSR